MELPPGATSGGIAGRRSAKRAIRRRWARAAPIMAPANCAYAGAGAFAKISGVNKFPYSAINAVSFDQSSL